MTTPAAAATSGPIASAARRPAPQAAADPFAFGAVLDSLPGTSAKADASTIEEGQPPSNESPQEESSRGQTTHHSRSRQRAFSGFAVLPCGRPRRRTNARSCERFALARLARVRRARVQDSGASTMTGAKAATSADESAGALFTLAPPRSQAQCGHARSAHSPAPGCDPTASALRRKRPCRRLPARGYISQTLQLPHFADCRRGVRDADRPSHGRPPNTSR
jgi:hypothetical protein